MVQTGTRRILFDSPSGYQLVESFYPAGHRMSPHYHDVSNISLVLWGGLDEESDRGSARVGAGCAVLRPAGNIHADVFGGGGAVLFSVEFEASRLSQRCVAPPGIPYLWCSTDDVSRRMLRLYARARAGAVTESSSCLDGEVTALLTCSGGSEVSRAAFREPPAWMSEIQEHVHSAADRPLYVDGLARDAGVHRVYLARVFRRCFGSSPTRYGLRLRTTQAAHRLAATHEPPAQIAFDAGFADQAHFCRIFRTNVGLTPRAYRRLAQTR